MSIYRVLQATNNNVGAVAVGENMPFGGITRRIQGGNECCNTFNLTTSGADTIVINECGNYNVVYNASLEAGAAGDLSIALNINGTAVYTSTVTATEGGTANVTIPYQIRVRPNCTGFPFNVPANITIVLGGVAVTGGTSNVLVERVY